MDALKEWMLLAGVSETVLKEMREEEALGAHYLIHPDFYITLVPGLFNDLVDVVIEKVIDKELWVSLHRVAPVIAYFDLYTGESSDCEHGIHLDFVSITYDSFVKGVEVLVDRGCAGGVIVQVEVGEVQDFLYRELKEAIYSDEVVEKVLRKVGEFLKLFE